jgi:hypothetical protein
MDAPVTTPPLTGSDPYVGYSVGSQPRLDRPDSPSAFQVAQLKQNTR